MNKRIRSIQGLRGIACLMVFFSHAFGAFPINHIKGLTFLRDGSIAVVMFFVLSGFFMYIESGSNISSCIKVIIKKAYKIYPVYIITLIIGTVICNLELGITINKDVFTKWFASFWSSKITVYEMISQFPIIWKYDADLINPPIWTMYPEMEGIFFIAFLNMIYLKKRQMWVIISALLGTIIMNYWGQIPQITWQWMTVFIIGYAGRVIVNQNQKYIYLFNKKYVMYFILMFFLIMCEYHNKLNFEIGTYLLAFSCVMIIFLSIYNIRISRILEWKIINFIGDMSYEFYLVHFIVLLTLRVVGNTIHYWLYILIAFVLTMACAYALNRTVTRSIGNSIRFRGDIR